MRLLLTTIAALLYLVAPAWSFGAHNPTWTDNPDIPNCTLVGPNSYANNPDCETYMRFPAAGFGTVTGGLEECEYEVGATLLEECGGGGPGSCTPPYVWDEVLQSCILDGIPEFCVPPQVPDFVNGGCLDPLDG